MSLQFTQIPYTLQTLIANIDSGILALPEIQRPFVWENAKVRDLLDSMYRGYPVGTLLFWLISNNAQAGRSIGQTEKTVPHSLIVDGQQRLTGLYAVIKGVAVLRNNYEREHIRIAFNPLKDEFMVPDASTLKDPAWLPIFPSSGSRGRTCSASCRTILPATEPHGEMTV